MSLSKYCMLHSGCTWSYYYYVLSLWGKQRCNRGHRVPFATFFDIAGNALGQCYIMSANLY